MCNRMMVINDRALVIEKELKGSGADSCWAEAVVIPYCVASSAIFFAVSVEQAENLNSKEPTFLRS